MTPATPRSRTDRLAQAVTPLWDADMGRRLALVRMRMSMDQAALGRVLGLSQQQVSTIERGRTRVCPQLTLARLQGILGDHCAFVLYGSSPEKYPPATIKERYYAQRQANQYVTAQRRPARASH